MNREHWKWIAVGLSAGLIAAVVDREQFFRSYLYGFILWFCLSLGALAYLMMHHLTGGRWGFAIRRFLEAALTPLPALLILFLVFFFGSPILRQGHGYFDPAWVAVRAVACFGVWIGLAWMLRRRSLRQDRTADPRPTQEMRALSGPGLVVYFLTLSFAMVDWLMELEPGWRSTMFPVIIIATQAVMALSGAIVAGVWLLPRTPEVGAIATTQAWHDLGKLLFAFVIFWTYVVFAQFLIIWSGNLPGESIWYRQRGQGGWEWMARAVAVACFFGPAAVLLFAAPKRNPRTLAKVAGFILFSQAAYLFWVVAPSFYAEFHVSWMDLVVPAAMGAVWLPLFWSAWKQADAIPRNDPRVHPLGVLPS